MADDEDSVDYTEEMASQSQAQQKTQKRNRNKVAVQWNAEKEVKLISAVEPRDFLWNTGNKDHKNRILRDAAWQEISEEIFDGEYGGAQLNAKWSNLRIQFKSYYSKSKQTKSGQGAGEYKVSWKHFNQMMFIAAAEDQQSTISESNLVSDAFLFSVILFSAV